MEEIFKSPFYLILISKYLTRNLKPISLHSCSGNPFKKIWFVVKSTNKQTIRHTSKYVACFKFTYHWPLVEGCYIKVLLQASHKLYIINDL